MTDSPNMAEDPGSAMPPASTSTEAGATPAASTQAGATPADRSPAGVGVTPPAPDSTGLEAALKREREARRVAEAELKRLKPQADGAEGLAAQVAELMAAKAKAERDALITRIASETGLPPVLADRMHGEDEISLREDASRILAGLAATAQPATPHMPNVGGPQGAPTPGTKTVEEWRELIRGKR